MSKKIITYVLTVSEFFPKTHNKATLPTGFINSISNKSKIHTIRDTYLPNGGRVLDTHIGSGSIRIAAYKAGNIELYGCEINKTHFDNQEKRFSHYKQQLEFEY